MTRLVLASGSPRRKALLTQLGLVFEAVATDADETPPKALAPSQAVLAIAERKLDAYQGRADARRDAHVLAVDTDVFLNGRLLGKPADPAAAERMLMEIQGRAHVVYSGMVVQDPRGERWRAIEASTVHLAPLAPDQARSYAATREPLDKAGGYAVQGQAASFITKVEGDYTNVIGLPVRTTLGLLARAKFPLPRHLQPS